MATPEQVLTLARSGVNALTASLVSIQSETSTARDKVTAFVYFVAPMQNVTDGPFRLPISNRGDRR